MSLSYILNKKWYPRGAELCDNITVDRTHKRENENYVDNLNSGIPSCLSPCFFIQSSIILTVFLCGFDGHESP